MDEFCFLTATTGQLQYALETLTRHDEEAEAFEEIIELLIEQDFDWKE